MAEKTVENNNPSQDCSLRLQLETAVWGESLTAADFCLPSTYL